MILLSFQHVQDGVAMLDSMTMLYTAGIILEIAMTRH